MIEVRIQLYGLGRVFGQEKVIEGLDMEDIQETIDRMNRALPKDAVVSWVMADDEPTAEDCWDGDETDKIIQ